MNIFLRYIPTSYTIYSRISGNKNLISWMYLFPLYCLLAVWMCGGRSSLFVFIFIYICVIAVYEIGYLFNDLKVVKSEINPTRRVDDLWYSKNFTRLVISRILFFFISLQSILFLSDIRFFLIFTLSIFVLAVAFSMHNLIRGRLNIFTFSFLSFMKYSCMLIVANDVLLIIMTYLSFSLLRTIEYASIKGYFFDGGYVANHLEGFRLVYCTLLFIFSYFVSYVNLIPNIYVFVPLYFFIFRLFLYLLPSTFKSGRNFGVDAIGHDNG